MKSKILILIAAVAIPFAFTPVASAQDSTIGTDQVHTYNGVPSSGTSEVDTLTIQTSTSGGTFTLTVANGRTTQPITWSATNATLVANVDAALEALPNIGTGGVTTAVGTMTAGIGTITITFAGKNAKMDFPLLSVTNNLITGGTTPTIATTTPGVAATFRNAKPGTLLIDTSTPDLYINDSTSQVNGPTWTKVSP